MRGVVKKKVNDRTETDVTYDDSKQRSAFKEGDDFIISQAFIDLEEN